MNESWDVWAITQHHAYKAHGVLQYIKQCVLGIIMNANKPLISFTPGDGWVIKLPHWMHKLHEDCIFPPILENGYGTCDMLNMFKGKVDSQSGTSLLDN